MHEEGQLAVGQAILAAPIGIGKRQGAFNRCQAVPRRRQRIDQPVPGGVLVVIEVANGTRALRSGIQRVDEHVGDGGRPRDFDAGAFQVLRHRRHLPIAGVDVRNRGMGGEDAVLQGAAQYLGAARAQRLDARRKFLMQVHQIIEKGIAKEFGRPCYRSKCHSRCRSCLCHAKNLPAPGVFSWYRCGIAMNRVHIADGAGRRAKARTRPSLRSPQCRNWQLTYHARLAAVKGRQ